VIANRLEQADIITTATSLPEVLGTQGIRLGVQEITRRGAIEPDMQTVARLLALVILNKNEPSAIAEKVHTFTAALGPVRFTW
jgi:glycine hydroxymethyltransferase